MKDYGKRDIKSVHFQMKQLDPVRQDGEGLLHMGAEKIL